MTINYTSLLGFAQPVTGTESGTWGTVVNDEITALVEQAVAGGVTVSVTAGDVTLTDNNGSSDQSRNAILLITGTPGTSRNVVAPSSSKVYIVKNSSDGAIVLKGNGSPPTTGVTIPVGVEALCFWNGSDFEIVGMNGPSSSTNGAVPTFDGTTGKVLQNNSGVTISAGVITASGFSGPHNGTVGATTPSTGVFTDITLNAQGDVRFADSDSSNWVAFQGASTIASNVTWTLPATDGSSNQVLTTNGSGTLSWSTPSGGITTGKSIAMAMIFGF